MSVLPFPPRGRWAWDARGHERAVRVSAHAPEGVINLSMWRDEICVGTVRLQPDEVAGLVEGLTEGLARLARQPLPVDSPDGGDTLREMEQRLTDLEARLTRRGWRGAVASVRGRAQEAWRSAVARA